MAILKILTDDNPRLRLKSQKVVKFDKGLRQLATNLIQTMQQSNGVGISAPQVGELIKLIVVDVPEDMDYEGSPGFKAVVVNPEIVKCEGEQLGEEGCLSVPGWYGEVKRFKDITVRGQDVFGKPVKIKASDFTAVVFQHEIDHLSGILFTDLVLPNTLHKAKAAEDSIKDEIEEKVGETI
ncbi:MAG: peptide deformylase [Chloroflexi bacterium]|uniref:Peptide deformylase n=1 Tax=Candidatus Chlorohelix allophototropha TaxID=3003348 RepID=A0A8T7M7G3_9CHLR|nr:peptide deformylase [Chloroflexota bacterium]WJW68009.1 peptide deformylase [Chloroflexota bacterium L227-S17]